MLFLTIHSLGMHVCGAQEISPKKETDDTHCICYINVRYLERMRANPFDLYKDFGSILLAKYNPLDNIITMCDRNSEYFDISISGEGDKTSSANCEQPSFQVKLSKDSLILFEKGEEGNITMSLFVHTTMVTDSLWDERDIVPTVNFLMLNDYFKGHYNVDLTDKLRINGNITYDLYTIWGDILLIRSNQWEKVWYVEKNHYGVKFYKYKNLCDLILSNIDFHTAANGKLRLQYHVIFKNVLYGKSDKHIEKREKKVLKDVCTPVYYINLRYLEGIKENPLKTKYELDFFEFPLLRYDHLDSLISGVTYDMIYEGVISKINSTFHVVSKGNKQTYILRFEGDTILLSPVGFSTGTNVNKQVVYKYIPTNIVNSLIWRCGDPIGVTNANILNEYLSEKYHFNLIRKLHLKFPYTYHEYACWDDFMLISSNRWDCKHVWMINGDSNTVRIYKYLNIKDVIYSKDSISRLKLKYKL